jgi:nitrogen fixation protein FixH
VALLPLALVIAAAVAAAVLSGGDPPARAATARVGPGPVARTLAHGAYRVALRLSPNRSGVRNRLAVRVTRAGRPLAAAQVTARFEMAEMDMGDWTYRLPERAPGRYVRTLPGFLMAGDWRVTVQVAPAAGAPFAVRIADRIGV